VRRGAKRSISTGVSRVTVPRLHVPGSGNIANEARDWMLGLERSRARRLPRISDLD
jgi:hypothetical protein